MSRLASAFRHFHRFTALVIGDFFFDTYITGRVKRISPEAPVPVLEVIKEESRPGGAGNVVLNLIALGAHVFAIGRVGRDREGDLLKERLQKEGVDTSALLTSPLYRTPVKKRLIADSQQLLRVDFEEIEPLDNALEEEILACLPSYIARSQVVAISDYAKGFLSKRLLAAIIEIARREKVPVIVDPKGSDFSKYRGASVLKPNLSEAHTAAKMPFSASLDDVAKHLIEVSQVDLLLITRSEAGMSLFEQNGERTDFPVQVKEVKDVTGAGDTVLSCICLALANGLDMHLAAELANLAACISIERLGCVQVTIAEMAKRLLETEHDRKVFDETHAHALRHILKDARYCLLILPSGQSIPNALFRAVKELREEYLVMVYIDDPHPRDEFVHLLSSLKGVDMIFLQKENLKHLCSCMQPQETYLLAEDGLKKMSEAVDLLDRLRSVSVAS
ncbi:MAG: D-glycero-beta-D-manno-heptose-7-phosphate kinase [Chlamydiae bacterium]|nr:D-glycero-beta-D-manno-heptose-7-phosphate kinase [Chlamydiota bacterium]